MDATKPDPVYGGHVSKAKLLIIDDDPTTCQLLALQLEMEGYACATLSDPVQVLEAITEESPTLVLVDYHLGTHDGLELLRTIRSHAACRDLPVVVMSALDHRQESEAAGASGFVLKPFSLPVLVTTLREVLEER
jgi:DNA-binding response OmpR family regulator